MNKNLALLIFKQCGYLDEVGNNGHFTVANKNIFIPKTFSKIVQGENVFSFKKYIKLCTFCYWIQHLI